ncbi:MAG: hypothetical protein WAK29_24095, partial [Terriglobales bacterium]
MGRANEYFIRPHRAPKARCFNGSWAKPFAAVVAGTWFSFHAAPLTHSLPVEAVSPPGTGRKLSK